MPGGCRLFNQAGDKPPALHVLCPRRAPRGFFSDIAPQKRRRKHAPKWAISCRPTCKDAGFPNTNYRLIPYPEWKWNFNILSMREEVVDHSA